MNQDFKITYHLGSTKRSIYPDNISSFSNLENLTRNWLKIPQCQLRYYWIENDTDEIDIFRKEDFESFIVKNFYNSPPKYNIHVINIGHQSTEISKTISVHENVKCKGCLKTTIIGFRYKCVQCPNYDLCENCEFKHCHSEHLMLRIPTNNSCSSIVETYIAANLKAHSAEEVAENVASVSIKTENP